MHVVADDSVAGGLLGYASAVQLHLERDPVLAATYLAFWHGVSGEADPAALDDKAAGQLLARSEAVARALRQRYPQASAPYRLADTLAIAVGVLAADDQRDQPEALLAALDRLVAPRLLVNGRYEYAGTLQESADLGIGADLWLRCRQSQACVAAHDKLFGDALGGVPLAAGFAQRLEGDARLRESPALVQLTRAIVGLDEQLQTSPLPLRDVAAAAAAGYWQVIGEEFTPTGAAASRTPGDAGELRALLELGRASAWLAGSEQLASAFTVVGPPLMDYSRLALQGGGFLAATAGVGLLFAGVQALALFDSGGAPPPRELNRLVGELHASTYRNFVGLRAESMLASNAIDTRLVRLGLTLDGVRDDVTRIETAQRARVRADYLVQDARRWTAFEQDNDRCFSLRSLNPKTGLLRPMDFRRCEDRFLQGAVRRAQYLNRAQDYVLDARYLEPADLRFPFHPHYPLLLTQAGVDSKAALAQVDPLSWQQHAAALLRLYQENPATAGDYTRRVQSLRTLRAPGARMHDALEGLVLEPGARTPAFRTALHQQLLDAYFAALGALAQRVAALDDPEADRYGKRLTEGLDQPLPEGRRLTAIEAALSDAQQGETVLRTCSDVADQQFLVAESGLSVESRRFFTSPITTEELARSWNRRAVDGFALTPDRWAPLVPRPFLWAALDGHGSLDICLATLRPAVVEFTREEALLRNHLRAYVNIEAQLEVRFTPGATLTQQLNLPADRPPIVVASYRANRDCSFAYRNDNEGCSRGQCLADLAPQLWSNDSAAPANGASCSGDPLPRQLARQNEVEGASELVDFATALTDPYWRARAERSDRLLADATRSREYETAAALYLQYFALAGTTLGTWPDPSAPLAPLFAEEGALTPRAVLQQLIDERINPATLQSGFAAVRLLVLDQVAARGNEVVSDSAWHRLPQLHALRETFSRIDLMLAAYGGG